MDEAEIINYAFASNNAVNQGEDSVVAKNLLNEMKLSLYSERNWAFLLDEVQRFQPVRSEKLRARFNYSNGYLVTDPLFHKPAAINMNNFSGVGSGVTTELTFQEALQIGISIKPDRTLLPGSRNDAFTDFLFEDDIIYTKEKVTQIIGVYDKKLFSLPRDVGLYLASSLRVGLSESLFRSEGATPKRWLDEMEDRYSVLLTKYYLPQGGYREVSNSSIKKYLTYVATLEFNRGV